MAFHREQKEKELRGVRCGSRRRLHHAAAREFGNPTRLKEQSYEVMGFRFETVWQDLHFALSPAAEEPGIYVDRDSYAGARNRRKRGDLCLCRCGV